MRFHRSFVVGSGIVIAVGGCASILGDFDVGNAQPDGGPPQDGSPPSDQSVSDAAAEAPPTDAPGDSEASAVDGADGSGPLLPLTCNTWRYPQPFPVANLDSAGGTSNGNYYGASAFSADANSVRVAAIRSGNPVLFTVYAIDKTMNPAKVTSVDMPYSGASGSARVLGFPRLINGFGVIVGIDQGGGDVALTLYPFRDALPIGALPTSVALGSVGGTNLTSLQIGVIEEAMSTYFVAVSAYNQSSSIYALNVGVAQGGPANLVTADSNAANSFSLPALAHVDTNMYIYVLGTGGAAFYVVPESGVITTAPPRNLIMPFAGGGLIFGIADATQGLAPATTNLAYEELDVSDAGGFGSFKIQAAPIANTALPSLSAASKLTFGKTYSDLSTVPFSGNHFNPVRLFGDDFVAVSPGTDSGGDNTTWVNFLWLNVNGVTRGDQSGPTKGLLGGHGSALSWISASPSAITPSTGAWNIAWVENLRDDAGLFYDTLFLNELDCQ